MRTLVVICPNCKGQMRMQTTYVRTARKKCVYCGKIFKVHKNVNNSQILREEHERRTDAI